MLFDAAREPFFLVADFHVSCDIKYIIIGKSCPQKHLLAFIYFVEIFRKKLLVVRIVSVKNRRDLARRLKILPVLF